jgi:NAD(P)-dependent dehydrogenase (short-subunit alcohol dehydrogenase family)
MLSLGIGKCIALELSQQGNNKIIINDIDVMKDEADKLVQEIRDAGGDAIVITADC